MAPKKFTCFATIDTDYSQEVLIKNATKDYSIEGGSVSWRAMHRAEAEYVYAHYLEINNAFSETDDKFVEGSSYAFYDENAASTNHYKRFKLGSAEFTSFDIIDGTILFPVTEVTIDSE